MNHRMHFGDICEENQAQLQALQQQQLGPKQCPRCDSMDTKFCYFNNYCKYQPRYYCKACRRYWTLGGTLRNVPVGGSRKAKRTKTSELRPIQPQPLPQLLPPSNASSPVMSPMGLGCYFPVAGGFIPPFEAIQPLQLPQGFNPSMNQPLGGDHGGSSSLGMSQGYKSDVGASSTPSIPQAQAQTQTQTQFYVGNRDKAPISVYPVEPSSDMGPQQQSWAFDFVANDKPNTSSENSAPMWNMNYAANPTTWKHFQQN